jgi:hypothetical protein
MIDKLHTVLRTVLLLALVLIGGWWTIFLRGKLGDHEAELRDAESTIATLETDLETAHTKAAGLETDLTEAHAEITKKDAAIAGLEDDVAERDARIEQLDRDLAASEAEVQALTAAMQLLKVDRRLARIEITSRDATPAGARTHFRFTELGPDGQPLGEPLELAVEGTRIYFEALVIKFDDSYVEAGDFLRGTSVCLFQRVFGERQSPDEGMLVESPGSLPAAYASEHDPDPFYADLWDHFWAYANNPKAAREKGVRTLHGEAPFIEARPGRRYRIMLRSSGGLSITPE